MRVIPLLVGVAMIAVGSAVSVASWNAIQNCHSCPQTGPEPHCLAICLAPWNWLFGGLVILGGGAIVAVVGFVLRSADQETQAALAELKP